jgi:hypothetical protein
VFENITNWKIVLPMSMKEGEDCFTPEFQDLLLSLLCEPEIRLGKDIQALKNHAVFNTIDWDDLSQMEPMFTPTVCYVC